MQRDAMDAEADFRRFFRHILRRQPAVLWRPGLAVIITAEYAGRGDGYEHAPLVLRIKHDGVRAHSAGPRLPLRPRTMPAQAGKFVPTLAAIRRAKHRRILDAG